MQGLGPVMKEIRKDVYNTCDKKDLYCIIIVNTIYIVNTI